MLIHKSRVFDLYSTSVNSRHAPFEYVGHRGSCAALVLDDDHEEIGLLAHHRPAVGRTLFEIPSRIADYGRPLEETILAELKESAGLLFESRQLQRLTSLYSSPGYSSELLTLFLTRITSQQKLETTELRWFRLSELNWLIYEQEIVDMKTVAAITSYQAVLWTGEDDEII